MARRVARTRTAPLLTLLLFAACAAPPKPAAPRASAPRPAPVPEAKPEPPLDLSAVKEPNQLVAVARVQASMRVMNALGTSFYPKDVVKDLASWLPEATREAVAPDAPLEIAIGVDSPEALVAGGPDVVVSIGLTSLGDLRRVANDAGVALDRRSSGVWRLNRQGVGAEPECWAFASVGPTPLRLECGSASALEALGAFVARSLPTTDLGPEQMVLSARPARLAREQGPGLSRAIHYLAPMLARGAGLGRADGIETAFATLLDDAIELAGDADELRMAVAEEAEGLRVTVSAKLASQRSWFARTLASYAGRGDGAREMFRTLPESAELAWFSSGPDSARTDEAQRALVTWLSSYFGPQAKKPTLELLAKTFLQRAPYVYAEGDASPSDARHGWSGRALWESTLSTFGWHLVGIDQPLKALVPELDAGMKAYNADGLRDLVYAELPRLCPGLGKIAKKPARARGLPAGSVLYQLDIPGKMLDDCISRHGTPVKERAPNGAFAVVAVPAGNRTWIGFGPEPEVMVARMVELVAHKPDKTLESRMDMAPVFADGVKLGGFVTLAGAGGLMRFLTMHEGYGHRRSDVTWLPNRGQSRMSFTLEVKPGTPTQALFTLHVPAGALADLSTRASPRL